MTDTQQTTTDDGQERLPVSVLTGFLGSGKTTLLKSLLKHPGMEETAVVINEFGEVVGINTFLREDLHGLGFAIAIGRVRDAALAQPG